MFDFALLNGCISYSVYHLLSSLNFVDISVSQTQKDNTFYDCIIFSEDTSVCLITFGRMLCYQYADRQ